jgi:competence protein ComEC
MVCTAIVWKAAADLPDGRLHLTVLDVGSGDAALVESPTGRFVLVDGGPSPIRISQYMGERLPFFHRKLDAVILAGNRYGHVAGLAGVAERFEIGNLMVLGNPGGSAYADLVETQRGKGAAVFDGEVGHRLELGGGADIELVGMGTDGGILMVNHGEVRILLASGADPELIRRLLDDGSVAPVQVAVLAGGGAEAVNPQAWLDLLDPWLAIISLQAGNQYGLPSPTVLERLEGRTVLRTDLHGWIRMSSDGERVWVETERAQPK